MSRDTGEYPLSIGTSICFESLKNGDSELTKEKRASVKRILISVDTLIRNLAGACRNDRLRTGEYVTYLLQEMELIEELAEKLPRKPSVLFYHAVFNNLEKRFPQALFREKTDKKLEYDYTVEKIVSRLMEQTEIKTGDYFDMSFGVDSNESAILISHRAPELLRFIDFDNMALLESHTGALKQRANWYTKFTDGKSLPPMPFCHGTLTICGDSNIFKHRAPARKFLISVATAYKWRGNTTLKYVRSCMKEHVQGVGEDKSLALKMMDF